MRSFWIILVGPKSNDQFLYDTIKKRAHEDSGRAYSNVAKEGKICQQPQETGRRKEGFYLRVF